MATSYSNVGYEWGELGNHEKALEYYKKALHVFQTVYGESHSDVALAYYSIGDEYAQLEIIKGSGGYGKD